MSITGLGPHGERAAPPSRITLSGADIDTARDGRFTVAVVLHTVESDYSKQTLSGIVGTLGNCATRVTEVVDCGFSPELQVSALERLSREPLDAIISIPVDNVAVADAHRLVSAAGKRLILHDNVPTGLLPGSDYTTLISADNFGLGLIGAELLSPFVDDGREVVILTYGVDFYATNERELAFGRWMRNNRPKVKVRTHRFSSLETVRETTRNLLGTHPALAGMFVVWDTPAMDAVSVLKDLGTSLPVTTVDLGRSAAISLAVDSPIIGIAAQQPYLQGVATAQAAILSMLGRTVPGWIALPGLAVTRQNVVESYQLVWNAAAPSEILETQIK
ncbi:MAG: substrate-binding domain-containing protein [Paracoccaceae bacterium]|jgi:ribose transport system substrate-binding protein